MSKRILTMDEVRTLAAKHNITAAQAVKLLTADGWTIEDNKADALSLALRIKASMKEKTSDIKYRTVKATKGKNGLIEFTVEYDSGKGWQEAKTRRMHPNLVKALAAAL